MKQELTLNRTSCHLIVEEYALGFNASDYSRFKYGSKKYARLLGNKLGLSVADLVRGLHLSGDKHEMLTKQLVVAPSPYNFIPTATFAMKDYFIESFQMATLDLGLRPMQEAKVFRSHSYNEDYGDMTKEQRRDAIGSESFYTDKEFLRGKHVLFLDDIRVTGAHEERMLEMIDRLKLDEVCTYTFVYFAEVYPFADINPKIENALNHSYVENLIDVNDIIREDGFIFNTRVTKFILRADEKEFTNFINYQSSVFNKTLMHYAIGNNYHTQEAFKSNFEILKAQVCL